MRTAGAWKVLAAASCTACAVAGTAVAADLDALSMEELMRINVVGASKYAQTQTAVAAAVSVITRQDIKAFGWRTLDEAIGSLPGVHTTYDRQYAYLGTRGFGLPGDYNSRVLVTIDGNRVNDPTFDTGPGGRNFPLDMSLVERIEFIPGPGGAVYGQNAMLGVVNVVTRRGADVGVELEASFKDPQSERELRASVGRLLDNGVDVLVSVSGLRARGEDRFFEYGAAGISGRAVGMDGERNTQVLLRVERGPWIFESINGDRVKQDPTAALLADPLVAGTYQADAYHLHQLRFDQSLRQDLQLSTRLFVGSQRFRTRQHYDGVPSALPADSDWRGLEISLVDARWGHHKLMAGIEAQDNIRQDQAALDLLVPANDIRIAGHGYRAGVFVQDEWQATATFAATVGVRVDRDNIAGYRASPRAALIWHAATAATAKFLLGRAHRSPNAFERDYADGFSQASNTALLGETIDTLELVVERRIGEDFQLRSSVYQWTLRDLITLRQDPVSGLAQYQTGDTVKARGVEQSASHTWQSGARLQGSISLQDSANPGGGHLLNSPRRLGKLQLSAPLHALGVHVAYELRYESSRLSRAGTRLGGYAISNVVLGTDRLGKGVTASLAVLNAFDKRYRHPGGAANWQNAFEQDGLSWRLALSQQF